MSNTITQSVQGCKMTLEAEIANRNGSIGTIPPDEQVAYQAVTDQTLALVDRMNEFLSASGDSPDSGMIAPPPMP